MNTIREIKSSDWPALCQRVSRQRAGATVKLETVAPDGVKIELAAGADFQSLVFEKTDDCSDIITLRLRNDREIIHKIIEPIRILLHPAGKPGDFSPVQIEAESGVTFLTMHPAIHAQMLDGFHD